jgi:hypothetical protein
MLDPPSMELRRQPTDSATSGKWVDNKKAIFCLELLPATTVHPLDIHIDPFLNLTSKLQLGPNSNAQQSLAGEKDMEDNLLRRINQLHMAKLEPLVKFLPLVLDKLLLLMVKPPSFEGHILNVGSAAFNAIALIVNKITQSVTIYCFKKKRSEFEESSSILLEQIELMTRNDRHGRNELLTEYIQYQAHLPHPDLRQDVRPVKSFKKTSSVDDEVGNITRNGGGDSQGTFGQNLVKY